MKRIMVNLDDTAGDLLEAKAIEQKRSASSYIALLVEADLRAAGLLPQPSAAEFAERRAKILAMLDKDPSLYGKVEEVVIQHARVSKQEEIHETAG